MKSGGSMDMIEFSGGEMCGGVKGDVWKSQLTTVKSERGFKALQMFCPFIVSTSKITQLDEVHKLLGELLKSAMFKVSHLEIEKTKLLEKLIGMKFNV
jgi:hypothetical protein